MLNIPEDIKNLFRADNTSDKTQKKFKLTFYDESVDTLYPYETLFPDESLFPAEYGEPWLVIENNRIESESLTITESLSEAEDLEFGSCEAAALEITVADVIEDVTNREFVLTVEIGGYEMAMGIYTVESFARQADRRKRKITAYDRMRWFNVDVSGWYNDLTFPMTLKSFRDSLCDYIGIQQEQKTLLFDSMQISKTIEPSQISGLDVLKAICQINGCFGHIDKTGQLVYVYLQQTGLYPSEELFPLEELYPSELGGDGRPKEIVSTYKELIYEDYLVEGINGLNIRGQEGDIGASIGENDNVYAIEGNFLVYGKSASELLEIAKRLLPAISEKSYRPAALKCSAMPWIEAGDAIIAPTRDDIVETFVMRRVIKGCQAMEDAISSSGSQKREDFFGIGKQIIQLEGKTAIITKSVDEVSVQMSNLKNYTESQFKITAESITSEVNRATKSEGELSTKITQTAEKIESEVSRATKAEGELSSKITQTAGEITLQVNEKVNKGDVTSQLNSELKITGNSIALTTGHFTVNAKNLTIDNQGNATFSGKLSAASGTFSGEITASVGKIGPWEISDEGLIGDAGELRSASISGGYITGTELDLADGILQVEDGYGNSSAIVRIGEFACSDEYGRGIFQSQDEVTGMSAEPSGSGNLYLWAGYHSASDYVFVVNNLGDVKINGQLYVNGVQVTGGAQSITGSVKSLKVGYDLDGNWGSDWLEIYPKNLPDVSAHPEYDGMDYLYVYLERHYA